MNRNTIVGLLVALVVVVALLVLLPFGKGNAVTGNEPCVPSPETTEVVVVTPEVPAVPGTPEVPAVTEQIEHPAETVVVPAVAEVWANFSPNDKRAPFLRTPLYPTDPEGTWHVHNKIPNGHEGPDGVYSTSDEQGNGSWFYRLNGKPETVKVVKEAWTETVVVTPAIPATPGTPAVPAVTQTIVTPAVTCDTPSETPTVTPTVPTDEPTVTPEEPETPVANPPKPPKNVQVTECVNGVFVTTVNGEVISEAGSCEVREGNSTPVAVVETGL